MNKKQYLTLQQLHLSRRIWWIKSLPTLKKWVMKDKDQNNLLKMVVDNDGKVPRYYFLPENVETYVKAFTEAKEVRHSKKEHIKVQSENQDQSEKVSTT